MNFEYTTMILCRTLLRILLAILINLSLRGIEVDEVLPKKELATDQNKMKSSVSRSLQLATYTFVQTKTNERHWIRVEVFLLCST